MRSKIATVSAILAAAQKGRQWTDMTFVTDGQRWTNLRLDTDRRSLCHTATCHVELSYEMFLIELFCPVALIAVTAIHGSIRTWLERNRSLRATTSTNSLEHLSVFTPTAATVRSLSLSPGRSASRTSARLVLVPFRRKELLLTCGKTKFSSTVPAH